MNKVSEESLVSLLNEIVAYKLAHDGCSPTAVELSEALGLSVSGIHKRTEMLVDEGRLRQICVGQGGGGAPRGYMISRGFNYGPFS